MSARRLGLDPPGRRGPGRGVGRRAESGQGGRCHNRRTARRPPAVGQLVRWQGDHRARRPSRPRPQTAQRRSLTPRAAKRTRRSKRSATREAVGSPRRRPEPGGPEIQLGHRDRDLGLYADTLIFPQPPETLKSHSPPIPTQYKQASRSGEGADARTDARGHGDRARAGPGRAGPGRSAGGGPGPPEAAGRADRPSGGHPERRDQGEHGAGRRQPPRQPRPGPGPDPDLGRARLDRLRGGRHPGRRPGGQDPPLRGRVRQAGRHPGRGSTATWKLHASSSTVNPGEVNGTA